MAVFVLGAGASRGASFVSPTMNPCLPPLDADFYAQLQRIRNPKHKQTLDDVIKDTVELFGVNFDVSMETVFTTLEHTERMIQTTGENRDFRRSDINEKKERLKQAIAATLEEALCEGGQHEGTQCEYHAKLVESLKADDEIVTFNYDCLIDEALRRSGDSKWNARYGYGFGRGKGRRNLSGEDNWMPAVPATKHATIKLYKLHGSLHFDASGDKVKLKQRPYTKQFGQLRFTIIPPESNKRYDQGIFKT